MKFIEPKLKEIKEISSKYRPKFINEFVGQGEQTYNMDINDEDSRSLGDALLV